MTYNAYLNFNMYVHMYSMCYCVQYCVFCVRYNIYTYTYTYTYIYMNNYTSSFVLLCILMPLGSSGQVFEDIFPGCYYLVVACIFPPFPSCNRNVTITDITVAGGIGSV